MKKLLTVLFIFVFAASLCFAAGKQDAKKGASIKMFQLKVEIKDAIDAYAADYTAATGIPVSVETLGGGGDYGGTLKAKAQSGNMPDIIQIEGQGGYDMSAGMYGSTRDLQSFLPEPAVWAQAVQNAGVYPELTYTSYRIRKGDMIGVIAERFGLTQDTLISINNIRQTRRIQIGDYIKVPSMPGILYTTKKDGETAASVAEKYQVSAQKTAAVNHLHEQGSLAAGTSLFVPDAFMDWVTRQEINGDLFRRPLRARYYVSSNFGWRRSPFTGKRTFHNGVDMASPAWTPVYAALAGTVTAAGFHSVYGNYVIVAHHSGYRTLYGHMVGIKARKGQSVDTRTVLGWVGTTGLSTGPHLHFSVFKYGSAVNPVSLWN